MPNPPPDPIRHIFLIDLSTVVSVELMDILQPDHGAFVVVLINLLPALLQNVQGFHLVPLPDRFVMSLLRLIIKHFLQLQHILSRGHRNPPVVKLVSNFDVKFYVFDHVPGPVLLYVA